MPDQVRFVEGTPDLPPLRYDVVYRNGALHHVYTGMWQGVKTRWVARTVWDGRVRLQRDGYADAFNGPMFVFQEGDAEYNTWSSTEWHRGNQQ